MAEMSKKLEDQIRAFSRRRILKSVLLTVAWEAVIIILWCLYSIKTDTPLTSPGSFAWTILLLFPILIGKVHKIWFDNAFTGTVTDVREVNRLVQNPFRGRIGAEYRDVIDIIVKTDRGTSEILHFEEHEQIRNSVFYREGDRIVKIRGAFYPLNLTNTRAKECFCPMCAHFTDYHETKCGWCRAKLIQQ